jgi:hypothetical protein
MNDGHVYIGRMEGSPRGGALSANIRARRFFCTLAITPCRCGNFEQPGCRHSARRQIRRECTFALNLSKSCCHPCMRPTQKSRIIPSWISQRSSTLNAISVALQNQTPTSPILAVSCPQCAKFWINQSLPKFCEPTSEDRRMVMAENEVFLSLLFDDRRMMIYFYG